MLHISDMGFARCSVSEVLGVSHCLIGSVP